ncbi:MAG: VanW family protein [Paludibacteraceae bacterium]|nr:VanW family protein [Paludibacteraceae bacterium]
MQQHTVEQPIERSQLRRKLGREFYILKRKLKWYFSGTPYAKADKKVDCPYVLVEHKSTLLRKLKDVDMQLQYNKVTNLKLAIAPINGVVIKPGETFSIWRMVGRPSARKGYKTGMMIHNGKVAEGVGGGLCQLGNLLYWMALHTPLTVTERWRHSFDVFPDVNRTIPFACGATLAYNYIDLQLKNNTDKCFRINLWLDEEFLHGCIRSSEEAQFDYEVYETDHCITQQMWGGYTRHNRIWRKITNRVNGETTNELVAENNAIMMYNPLLEGTKQQR